MRLIVALAFLGCATTREAGLERVEHCRVMSCLDSHPDGALIQRRECVDEAVLRCRAAGIDEEWCRPSPGETYAGQCVGGGGL